MKLKEIKLPFRVKKPVLSLGSNTKNTICLIKDDIAYLSPIHADLTNPEDLASFEKDAGYFLKKNPKVIAYDLHPEYEPTKYALNLSPIPATKIGGSAKYFGGTYHLTPIQHHHAHIASCMLENALGNQKVIGVAFDGTGLGSDGKLWGAEFFLCDYKNFKRAIHLEEIPLLGGECAILEPARLTLAWLYRIYKDGFLNLNINFIKGIDRKKWRVLKNMYLAGFNAALASSMGRLFDAVASLLFAKYRAGFEAELAIELEKVATAYKSPGHQVTRSPVKAYDFKIAKGKDSYTLNPLPMFKQIILELKAKEPKEKIAYRFHLTIARMVRKGCLILRKENNVNKVVLSGGVFQNKLLLNLSLGLLYKEGFEVLTHKKLSCNDSGISLGQAVIADLNAAASKGRLSGDQGIGIWKPGYQGIRKGKRRFSRYPNLPISKS